MKNKDSDLLSEIETILMEESEKQDKDTNIPKEKVNKWIQSNNIEVLGAVFCLLTGSRYYPRITPYLSVYDYHPFMMHFYERCLLEDPDGEWSYSSYEAGGSLIGWFKGLWYDPDVPRKMLDDLKKWLAKLYIDGDEELRICIVNATLEHLFEKKDIAKYFADWKKDPILKIAYSEAMLWSNPQKKNNNP